MQYVKVGPTEAHGMLNSPLCRELSILRLNVLPQRRVLQEI